MRDPRLLLRHNHWLTLHISGHEVQLCARCSGTVVGYLASQLLQHLIFSLGFSSTGLIWQVLLAYVLALPSGVDWLTQTWGFRTSTNRIRFCAGLLVGAGAGLLALSSLEGSIKVLVLGSSSIAVISTGYLGRKLIGARLLKAPNDWNVSLRFES